MKCKICNKPEPKENTYGNPKYCKGFIYDSLNDKTRHK